MSCRYGDAADSDARHLRARKASEFPATCLLAAGTKVILALRNSCRASSRKACPRYYHSVRE